MIEAQGLSKTYGSFIAAWDVTFTVKKGTICAFLGPNGAGKSTTMKMLTGYLSPYAGKARICGHDVFQDRIVAASKIGYLPENGPLYENMTPREMLAFIGEARGMSKARVQERVDELKDACGLGLILQKPIFKLSKGNRQRVGMAQALLHEPEVLILDEPMTGLDPNQIHSMRELILEIGKEKTVLLSTHIMQEVKALASQVVFIAEGRVQFDGNIKDFTKLGEGDGDRAFRSLAEKARSSADKAQDVLTPELASTVAETSAGS